MTDATRRNDDIERHRSSPRPPRRTRRQARIASDAMDFFREDAVFSLDGDGAVLLGAFAARAARMGRGLSAAVFMASAVGVVSIACPAHADAAPWHGPSDTTIDVAVGRLAGSLGEEAVVEFLDEVEALLDGCAGEARVPADCAAAVGGVRFDFTRDAYVVADGELMLSQKGSTTAVVETATGAVLDMTRPESVARLVDWMSGTDRPTLLADGPG